MADRRTTRRTRVAAAALAVVAVVAGFTLGYLIATRSSRAPGLLEASPPGSGTTAVVPPTTVPEAAPPATSSPTSRPPETAPDAGATTTTAPPPSAPPSTPAPTTTAPVVVTVAPPVTRPPTTAAPPRVEVLYLPDAFNRVVIPRVGAATLTIRNTGGAASQWLITGSGFTVRGPTLGILQPGQSVDVAVVAPADVPKSGATGTISVLGAVNPSIPFIIRGT